MQAGDRAVEVVEVGSEGEEEEEEREPRAPRKTHKCPDGRIVTDIEMDKRCKQLKAQKDFQYTDLEPLKVGLCVCVCVCVLFPPSALYLLTEHLCLSFFACRSREGMPRVRSFGSALMLQSASTCCNRGRESGPT